MIDGYFRHIFATASLAHNKMFGDKMNQCIVIRYEIIIYLMFFLSFFFLVVKVVVEKLKVQN
jgi:hypothetical protein